MISPELQKKVDASIKLLQSIKLKEGEAIEVAYSGGKDSACALQLAKEAGIRYRAIHKNTTIDPPGTTKHCREIGAEIVMPRKGYTFFKLIERNGMPSRYGRFCCKYLKEYKILDKAIIGVRRGESKARAERYKEPTMCRIYPNHARGELIMPLLDWTDEDVKEFILDRGIVVAPLYYKDGVFDASVRLGCLCCPLQSRKRRLEQLRQYPNMVKGYVRAMKVYYHDHPNIRARERLKSVYDAVFFNIFCDSYDDFEKMTTGLFSKEDTKTLLENYFHIKFREE